MRKGKPHQLMWSISMFLFWITAGSEAVSLIIGHWNILVYRAYYLFAAIQVSLMGAGLLYLFTRRNIIHQRNSAKAVLLFWGIWLFFGYLFLTRDPIFNLVVIPSVILIILSILYFISDFIDQRKNIITMICSSCKMETQENCINCEWGSLKESYKSTGYAIYWQKAFKNDNFAHLFVIFIVFIFGLMNLYVWDLPLTASLLHNGKEVSGTPWQPLDSNGDVILSPRAVIRLFSPLHTVPGAIALIGGGIYSYVNWQISIKKTRGSYQFKTGIFNLYIAFGAWVLGLGATLSGFGLGTLYISEIISVSFMYFGFLESDKMSYQVLKDFFSFLTLKKTVNISAD